MSDAVSISFAVLVFSFAVGVLWLWAKDRLYTMSTGKPASERVRERNERLSGPISLGQYLGRSLLLGAFVLFFLYASSWTGYHFYKGWARAIPLGWALSGGFSFCQLQIKWHRQQRVESPNTSPPQLSGPAK
jgi:hypothetical protein